MKVLIFDSGPLINLSMNGLLYILEDLKKNFDGKFIITKQVKYEIIDRPIGIPRFELGAMEIEDLIEKGVLELPDSLGLDEELINRETKRLMGIANSFISVKSQFVNIVSDAEISCLAVSAQLTKKNIKNLIAIDERTTRLLSEKPDNLERTMSERLHQRVELNPKNIREFSEFQFIRSSELVYVAYKKNILRVEGKKALEAVLYATKYKGSSITFEEIDSLKKLV